MSGSGGSAGGGGPFLYLVDALAARRGHYPAAASQGDAGDYHERPCIRQGSSFAYQEPRGYSHGAAGESKKSSQDRKLDAYCYHFVILLTGSATVLIRDHSLPRKGNAPFQGQVQGRRH